jgi:hypothetical protein
MRHETSLCPGPLAIAPSPASADSWRIIPTDGPSHLVGPTRSGPGQNGVPGALKPPGPTPFFRPGFTSFNADSERRTDVDVVRAEMVESELDAMIRRRDD